MADPTAVDAALEKVVAESQRTLKAEWKRVKRGEPPFYIMKYVSLVLAIGALLWLGVTLL